MRTKVAVILLLAIFALSSITMITIRPVSADTPPQTLMLINDELMSSSFKYEWGPGTLGPKVLNASGVEFDFTGLTSSDTGVGNPEPMNPLAGGKGPNNRDFTGYTRYSMLFKNVGLDPVQVCLFMNTGYWEGQNTYWRSDFVTIGVGLSAVVTLDFSSSAVAAGYWNGNGKPVQNIVDVTNIGFQVMSGSDGKIVVSALPAPLLYTAPTRIQKTPLGDIGTTFPVSVTLENFANFAGFDIKLTWDSSLITVIDQGVDFTTALNNLWGVGNWAWVVNASGPGSYELAAAALGTYASNAGASVLFTLTFTVLAKSSNVQLSTSIHFAVDKLSDNTTPVPNPITATVTDGTYTMGPDTTPDLEFKVLKWNTKTHVWDSVSAPYKFEYGNSFEVEVYVTDIIGNSPLQDFDVKISFDHTLARFVDVDVWGVLGTGTVSYTSESDVVEVSRTNVAGWYGAEGLLFTLTFHVEFTRAPEHIWKYEQTNYMTFQLGISDATLSFGSLGTIPMSGIRIPSALTIEVDWIRGDVTCDGIVNMADISLVAQYYGQPASAKPEYDLTNDGVIIDIYDIVVIAQNYGYGLDP